MKIIITGSYGQLGSEIQSLSSRYASYQFVFTDLDILDITQYESLEAFIKKHQPDALINCAAYTAVDKAEREAKAAQLINLTGVKNLAELSAKYGFLLVHVSTDYVFDGTNYKPYTENASAAPLSVYAKSKYDGEIEILFHAKKAVIIRTSWLYSSYGNNFVKTIMRYAKERGHLDVIYDQVGAPTYAADLAEAILKALPIMQKTKNTEIYNYANEGVASWYDFAKAIVKITGIKCTINPIETKDFKTDALRPFYTVLNKSKFKKTFNQDIPYWRDSLEKCISKISEK